MIEKGTATFKDEEYFRQFCAKNRTGIITAYLPEENIFAVFFGEGQWCTFEWTEEEFLDRFEVDLNEL
jgi:hypothetical protein